MSQVIPQPCPEQVAEQVAVWLTRQQLADRLQLPKQTLAQWACRGEGPKYSKIGRWVRYRLADVEAWEQSLQTSGPQEVA